MTGTNTPSPERPKIAAMERGPGPAKYTLPSLTGVSGHDPTKKLHPCFSFGTKLGTSFFRKDFGPGPSHFLDPMTTRHGRDGTPHYSLFSRNKALEPFKTPAPGNYAPEKYPNPYSVRSPTYSMGARTKYRRRDANPSPASYTLPTLIGDKIPNRTSSACYSMAARSKLGGFDQDHAKTPGPARYGVTSADITRRTAPNYSIQSRNYMPEAGTKVPGPGAHCPEKVVVNKKSSPSYSMGTKHSEFVCPLILDASD